MSAKLPKIILASRSPRRRQLLREAGYRFVVIPPREAAEGDRRPRETPAELVARLARRKAEDVAGRCGQGLVVGCDTVVECGGRILGKPRDADDARRILQALGGSVHHVHSGLCLWPVPGARSSVGVAKTKLRMAAVTDSQLEQYLATGQWQGKAGAFGYQDGHDWLEILEGSQSNVVGLPLELLAEMIRDVYGT